MSGQIVEHSNLH